MVWHLSDFLGVHICSEGTSYHLSFYGILLLPNSHLVCKLKCPKRLHKHINKLIVTSEMTPDIGPVIRLNTIEDQSTNTTESTGEQEVKTTDPDDAKNNAEIENVVKNLLRAINDDQDQNMEDEKNKIITQYYQDDEIVDLEIDDYWLIMDQWGETPAIDEMIPMNFEDL